MAVDSLFDLFGASESESEDGKWFPFGKTIEVKIRRFKSKRSRKVREALEEPYKRASKFGGSLPDEVTEEISNQHIADGIVADWRGVNDINGNPIPYSWQAAVDLFEKLPDFRDAVAEISMGIDNFREETKEDVEKN